MAKLYYPLFLDIRNKTCLIVGGGRVAERKARTLLAFGAKVKLVSPKLTAGLLKLEQAGKIEVLTREYIRGDLEGAHLAFVATNRVDLSKALRKEATEKNVLLNVADDPALCDFIVPSITAKGPIIIAISTSGTLPLLAKKLRREIDRTISKDYTRYVVKVAKLRHMLMERVKDRRQRTAIMKEVARADVGELAVMSLKEMKRRFIRNRPEKQ